MYPERFFSKNKINLIQILIFFPSHLHRKYTFPLGRLEIEKSVRIILKSPRKVMYIENNDYNKKFRNM